LSKITKVILVITLIFAILLGGYLGWQRILQEKQSKVVEIAVDYRDIQRIALEDKIPVSEVLTRIQTVGVTSIGLPEETLDTAAEAGNLIWAPGYELVNLKGRAESYFPFSGFSPKKHLNYVQGFSHPIRNQIYQELLNLLGKEKIHVSGNNLIIDHYAGEVKEFGIGMDTSLVNWLKNLDFYVIPRLSNNKYYQPKSIFNKILLLKKYDDFDYVIFEKEEVLGQPNNLDHTAKALKDFRIKFGYVEFSKQDGDRTLAKTMGDQIIKVHSIPNDEILERKITKDKAVSRFSRAVRERGVRLLYVHPFFNVTPKEGYLEYNAAFISSIKDELNSLGFQTGKASAIEPLRVELWQLLVMGMGVFVFGIALIWYFSDMVDWLVYLLAAAFFVAMLAVIQTLGFLSLQKILAALAAVVVPTYAIISNFEREPHGYSANRALQIVLHCIMDTLLGIILIIGLLADSRFMLGAELFQGVKIVLLLPAFIVVAYFFNKDEYGTNLWDKFKKFMQVRLPVAYLFWGLLLTAAAGILLARSGNFILPVLGLEKGFRIFLEQVFFARPRIKEFLIGYPFLYFAASYCLNYHKRWLWFLLAVGSLGLTSLTNTFCHIHTPILFSIIRSVNGIVLGLLIGVVINAIALFIVNKRK